MKWSRLSCKILYGLSVSELLQIFYLIAWITCIYCNCRWHQWPWPAIWPWHIHAQSTSDPLKKVTRCIREKKTPDDKKTPATFCTKFLANFHFFVSFPQAHAGTQQSHSIFTMHQYIAKQHSRIIYFISQQSHVMHELVLWNLELIHIIIIVTHETIDGQPNQAPVHNNIWSSLWFRTVSHSL